MIKSLIYSVTFLLVSFFLAIASAWTQSPPFSSASVERQLQFPFDHGAHADFQTEWWYYTGHLLIDGAPADLPQISFQLTFFRRSGRSGAALDSWDQQYMAHAALSDTRSANFYSARRQASAGLGVAGSSAGELRTWLQGWKAERRGNQHHLQAAYKVDNKEIELSLVATEQGQPLLHGQNGYSQKGNCSTCASHYYSLPGMTVSGTIRVGAEVFKVRGLVWMDHEFMSSALDKDQVGWDWFAFMGPDNMALMLFALRQADGSWSYTSGTLRRGGITQVFKLLPNQVRVKRNWRSAVTGAEYPVAWQFTLPQFGLDFSAEARFEAQEHTPSSKDSIVYWEGALSTSQSGLLGYAELTGYAAAMKQDF